MDSRDLAEQVIDATIREFDHGVKPCWESRLEAAPLLPCGSRFTSVAACRPTFAAVYAETISRNGLKHKIRQYGL